MQRLEAHRMHSLPRASGWYGMLYLLAIGILPSQPLLRSTTIIESPLPLPWRPLLYQLSGFSDECRSADKPSGCWLLFDRPHSWSWRDRINKNCLLECCWSWLFLRHSAVALSKGTSQPAPTTVMPLLIRQSSTAIICCGTMVQQLLRASGGPAPIWDCYSENQNVPGSRYQHPKKRSGSTGIHAKSARSQMIPAHTKGRECS